jgi:two-component system, NarL family, nitrate/nitrite response regulator NarL
LGQKRISSDSSGRTIGHAASKEGRNRTPLFSVLVVDDQPLFREGVVVTLNRASGFNVIGEACSGAEALSLVRSLQPDIVLLDLELPDGSGIDFISPIVEACPTARVTILTGNDDDDTVLQALRAGAAGYLLKGASLEELIIGVRDVSEGHTYASPAIAMRVLRHANAARSHWLGRGLTVRDQEILDLLSEGMTNQEIADHLRLNEKTVKRHVTVILKRLGARNRVEAALVVWRRRACGNHLDCAKRKPMREKASTRRTLVIGP